MDPQLQSVIEQQQSQINQLLKHVQHLEGQVQHVASEVGKPVNVVVDNNNNSHKLQPKKPPVFDGKDRKHDVDTWLNQLERYFKACGVKYITDKGCVDYAVSLLEGDASVWWDNLENSAELADAQPVQYWTEFKEAIRAMYQQPNTSPNSSL